MNSQTDGGFYFVKFLTEECAPELEKLDQADINAIAHIIRLNSDRDFFVKERDNPLKQLKKLPEPTPKAAPKKKAPKKKKK